MPIFQGTSFPLFPVHLTHPLKLWQNKFELFSGDNNKNDWKPVLLILELVMCAPQSNAALERFFSQLNYIKTNTRGSLSSSSLNSLLSVTIRGPALQEYHNEQVEVVEFW